MKPAGGRYFRVRFEPFQWVAARFPSQLGRLIGCASARPNHLGVAAKAPEQQDTQYQYV
jgi:hypothetical protein